MGDKVEAGDMAEGEDRVGGMEMGEMGRFTRSIEVLEEEEGEGRGMG